MKRAVSCVLIFCVASSPALAWNPTGHKVIASIAYARLDEATRQRVADALKNHPAYQDLWMDRSGNGTDGRLNLFWNAATFPDDARSGAFERFSRPLAHYVNFRVMAEQNNKVEEPLSGENIL